MPKKPKELERIHFRRRLGVQDADGFAPHYTHPTKPGKVTIPFHCKDIPKGTENSILKQAGLK